MVALQCPKGPRSCEPQCQALPPAASDRSQPQCPWSWAVSQVLRSCGRGGCGGGEEVPPQAQHPLPA